MAVPTSSGQCPEVRNLGTGDLSHYVEDLYNRVCAAETAATTLAARVTALEAP